MIVARLQNGIILKKGDRVKTFRGDEVIFQSAHQQGANRVYCTDGKGRECEWFPSVIDATLEEEE